MLTFSSSTFYCNYSDANMSFVLSGSNKSRAAIVRYDHNAQKYAEPTRRCLFLQLAISGLKYKRVLTSW